MRRKWLIVLCLLLLLVGSLVWVSETSPCFWVGNYDLTIHVSSTPGPPRSVYCQAFSNRGLAEAVLKGQLVSESRSGSTNADPFTGQPLTLTITISGVDTMLGRQVSRSQAYDALLVTAVLPDRRLVGKVVDIPDSRVSREVQVELP